MPSESAGLKGHSKVNILVPLRSSSADGGSPVDCCEAQFVCKSARPATALLSKSGTWAAGLLKSKGPAKTFL